MANLDPFDYWINNVDKLKSIPFDTRCQVKSELQTAKVTGKVSKDLISKLEIIVKELNSDLINIKNSKKHKP